ncbi:MAG: 50S ribosomal protein L4 [Nitrospirae bacterium]|nr:50S ribosomal protein L4 [Nitrospirota bacterium]
MPELEIKDKNNNTAGRINLPDEVFGIEVKNGILHEAVTNFLANQRQGTHATKTKGLVSGGGRKPWKQKHTGRARAGGSRSPLWRSGGTVFGPQPRDYSYGMPKQAKRLSLKMALSAKLADGEIVFIDAISMEKPKTKEIVSLIKRLGLDGQSLLIIIPEHSKTVKLSAMNIPEVSVMRAADLNAYNVISHDRILITKEAVEGIREAAA